jgi:hypothetical protein
MLEIGRPIRILVKKDFKVNEVAEREGFEPSVEL